jgi:glutamine amidotransferase/cyclase
MVELRKYIQADRPFFGICIGMQSLFEGSDESPDVEGLGVIPGKVTRFASSTAGGTMVR